MKTQKDRILEYLEKHDEGLNSYYATYEMRIKQAPTRVKELKNAGYTISKKFNKDGSVNWYLISKPPRLIRHYVFKDDGTAEILEEMV